MSSPIDVVLCFHNAFRRDMAEIDYQVLNIAQHGGNLLPVLDRLHVMDEILDYHARGEEAASLSCSRQCRTPRSQSVLDGSSRT